MSGFVVILHLDGRPIDPVAIERLTDRLAERGPDGRRIWCDGDVAMGHALRRTTHQDAFDRQPLCRDGMARLVSSARIDDRQSLLDRIGDTDAVSLDRTPDAELILRAYRKWGRDCPAQLLGDFAFAIWDARDRRLVCARDPFGMRQLYYARVEGALLVSNSLYCLLGHPGISRRLDDEAVGEFLLFGDHTWADKGITALADVKAVPPAHRLVFSGGRHRLERYWSFPVEVPLLRYRREGDYIEHFRSLFEQAVADRMRTRSLVIAMSGGMDSSSMAAMAVKAASAAGNSVDLHALTVLYDRIMPSKEREYASLVARHLGIDIRYLDGGQHHFLESRIATTRPLEFYNAGVWAQLYRTAAGLGPAILNGEGGDSLFAYSCGLRTLSGAGPLRVARDLIRLRKYSGTWPGLGTGLRRLRSRLTGKGSPWEQGEPYPYPDWLDAAFAERLGLRQRWEEAWHGKPAHGNLRHPSMQKELTGPDWHVDELLLHPGFTFPEVRDPFLDLRLVAFMLALPPMPWSFRKHMLRRSMAGDLPDEILHRKKTPLGESHVALMQQPEARWIDRWRLPLALHAYVDPKALPPLRVEGMEPGRLYVALRPLLLDRWIGDLHEALDAHVGFVRKQ